MHPCKTAEAVAARIGAPPRTVEKWLAGESAPSAVWLGPILAAYGPDFLAVAFDRPPDWLDHAARQARLDRLERERMKLAREIDALGA